MIAPWDRAAAGERDWFSRLGDGVIAVLPSRPGGPRGMPLGGAWIHVGGDGKVRAFSGKVEVGQGTKTALALLVAEELDVPPSTVELILGDTDVVPWDMGTFGSMAMPVAGAQLRLAAAGLRRLLTRLAGERKLDPGQLGAIAAGRRHVETIGEAEPHPPAQWRRAGRATPNRDGEAVVTGALGFVTDLRLPGMLHGRILHPPTETAQLHGADVARARALPDVIVVHEGNLVAVAAPTPAAAQAALEAIVVRWDVPPLPAEHEIEAWLRAHPSEGEGFWGKLHEERGDVESAFARAAVRLDATYRTAFIAHAPLECHCAVAEPAGERTIVHVGTQTPFRLRQQVAEALGVAEDAVEVRVPPTGGGFGGKHGADVAVAAAKLARLAARPVRIAFSRAEELEQTYLRPLAVIDVRAGLDGEGKLLGWDFRNVNSGSAGIASPYRVADERLDYQPAESPLRQGSYRALAATANNFAREAHIDELAARAQMDPLDFRLRHLADARLADVLQKVAARAGWPTRPRGDGRGAGIACGLEKNGRVATFAEVRVDGAGRLAIARIVTGFECGAIVNPDNLRNQIEGATIMGLGGALFERSRWDGGRVLDSSFASYRVPRFSDVPPIEVLLCDRPDLPSSGGGETPIIALAPAIANAIAAATGVRLRALPLAPDGHVAR